MPNWHRSMLIYIHTSDNFNTYNATFVQFHSHDLSLSLGDIFFVQYVFVRCLSMRHTCCWLVKHLNKHMQLACMLHICTCSLSFIDHFEKNAWHVTIHYLMNRNRFERKRERASKWHSKISYSSHRLYWQKQKNFIFKNSTHLTTLFMANYNNFHLFYYRLFVCVFVEFCRNSVSTSFKIKPSLMAKFSIRMIYF